MAPDAQGGGPSVLIAEDDEGLLLSLRLLLHREGFSVTAATGGDEALQRLANQRFDLVLTDLRMPGMDGIGVLQEAKRLQPGVQVVLMTCYGDMDTYMRAMNEGAFEYLNKPFDREGLLSVIRRALEAKGPVSNPT